MQWVIDIQVERLFSAGITRMRIKCGSKTSRTDTSYNGNILVYDSYDYSHFGSLRSEPSDIIQGRLETEIVAGSSSHYINWKICPNMQKPTYVSGITVRENYNHPNALFNDTNGISLFEGLTNLAFLCNDVYGKVFINQDY